MSHNIWESYKFHNLTWCRWWLCIKLKNIMGKIAGQSFIAFCQLCDINKLLSRALRSLYFVRLLQFSCFSLVLFFVRIGSFDPSKLYTMCVCVCVLTHGMFSIKVQIRFFCLSICLDFLEAECDNDLAPRPPRSVRVFLFVFRMRFI